MSYFALERRSFTCPLTGKRTSIMLEEIFWAHLELRAIRCDVTWQELLQSLMESMPAEMTNFASFVRSAIFKLHGEL